MSKRDEIIEKTIALYAEKGPYFSLSEVGLTTGLKKQSVYNYFDSKETLVNEVLSKTIGDYRAAYLSCLRNAEGLQAKEKIEQITEFMFAYFADSKRNRIRKWITLGLDRKTVLPIMSDFDQALRLDIKTILLEASVEKKIETEGIDQRVEIFVLAVRGALDGLLLNLNGDSKAKLIQLITNEVFR